MEFPKRIHAVRREDGTYEMAEGFTGLPADALGDGAEVAIYGLLRVKRVQVTRKLVAAAGEVGEDEVGASAAVQEALDGLAASTV